MSSFLMFKIDLSQSFVVATKDEKKPHHLAEKILDFTKFVAKQKEICNFLIE